MNLSVVLDFRFTLTPDGRVWTRTTYARPFWDRYLSVFDKVRVIARAEPKPFVSAHYKPVNTSGVEFLAVPYYLGPWQYLKVRSQVRQRVRSGIKPTDAVLCRVGSRLASDLMPVLWSEDRPYGLEVVGDPQEALAKGAVRHVLRPLFRAVATSSLKKQCARAAAVSYVTEFALQRRYPAGQDRYIVAVSDAELNSLSFSAAPRWFSTHYPSTDIGVEAYASAPKMHGAPTVPKIAFVGSLEQMYKGPDVLLQALARLKHWGIPVQLALVGDGRHRAELEHFAQKLQVSENVTFYGELPSGEAVREQLDWANLFVLPSRTEGLPRVLVEAMARALPCIATTVGGIPELLAAEDMVPPNDSEALASKIREVISTPGRMNAMSVRNLARSQEFRPELLQQRRTEFYQFLHDVTRDWLASRYRSVA